MTEERQTPGVEKRAADDVAADMKRRLEVLGDHVHEAERRAAAPVENPLRRVAGDPEAIAEGPLSGGATLSAAQPLSAPEKT